MFDSAVLQGSWMVQFFTVIVSLYLFSHAYNVLLVLTFPGPNGGAQPYTINSKMGITNSNLMKVFYIVKDHTRMKLKFLILMRFFD